VGNKPSGSTSNPKSSSVSGIILWSQPSNSYTGATSSPIPFERTQALAQSLNNVTPILVCCSSFILSNSLRTIILLISNATTKTLAFLARKLAPNAKFAAVLKLASPPLHPIPCSSTFSTGCVIPNSLHTKWSKPGLALLVQVVETTCVMSRGESCASWRAFREAVTASATPSLRKTLQSSVIVGARSMFAMG
jgi:hypothetical protein